MSRALLHDLKNFLTALFEATDFGTDTGGGAADTNIANIAVHTAAAQSDLRTIAGASTNAHGQLVTLNLTATDISGRLAALHSTVSQIAAASATGVSELKLLVEALVVPAPFTIAGELVSPFGDTIKSDISYIGALVREVYPTAYSGILSSITDIAYYSAQSTTALFSANSELNAANFKLASIQTATVTSVSELGAIRTTTQATKTVLDTLSTAVSDTRLRANTCIPCLVLNGTITADTTVVSAPANHHLRLYSFTIFNRSATTPIWEIRDSTTPKFRIAPALSAYAWSGAGVYVRFDTDINLELVSGTSTPTLDYTLLYTVNADTEKD